jgi:hypothetical protein
MKKNNISQTVEPLQKVDCICNGIPERKIKETE